MLFSLLVANYNNGHFFKDCYKSIMAQSYRNWEVIIVDDGSTDNSLEEIKKIIGNDKRFQLFPNKENRGCGSAKLKCTNLAKGELLGFLDPDDALVNNALEKMVAKHQEHQRAAIITSKYYLVDLNMRILGIGAHGQGIPEKRSYLTYGNGALTAFATFKKKFYLETEGIDPKMKRAVDQDLYLKMEERGQHIFLDLPLYFYRIHNNSISQNKNFFKAEYWHFYAMEKAFKRRRKLNLNIENFSQEEFKKFKMNYYLKRLERIRNTSKYCTKFYFIVKVCLANPSYRLKNLLYILKIRPTK